MEKIYLKPTPQEVLIKGAAGDGHLDVFSYEPNGDENARKLGNLFVVGHVQHETDDMAYSISLMAALAKREYYARTGVDPKEAFAATLKKINEVVEEFFQHQGVKINIGIFALAGDRMYISKLGKFKVLLAREEKTIDVLNNIDLFDKEKVEDRQFSSVISGKISPDDRILAFYPGRSISARERYLKTDLLKLKPAEFVKKLQNIKAEKQNFACAAVYVDLKTVKEAAIAPKPRLAAAPAPAPVPAKPAPSPVKELPSLPDLPEAPRQAAPSEPVLSSASKPSLAAEQEMPKIIASEFSLGRKRNPVTAFLGSIRFINMTAKKKAVFSLAAAGLMIAAALGVKAFFLVSPEAKKLEALLDSAETQLKLAQAKADEEDTVSARSLLTASLAMIAEADAKDQEKAGAIKVQLMSLLDSIDQARETAPVFIAQVPQELGRAEFLASLDETVFAYSYNQEDGNGYFSRFELGSLKEKFAVKDLDPAGMFDTATSAALVDVSSGRLATSKEGSLAYADLKLPEGVIGLDFYEENLYVMTVDGISKIADAAASGGSSKPWLKAGVSLPADAAVMAVDGNIYVMTEAGFLLTYYRGEKESQAATSLIPSKDQLLLTTAESPNVYLVNKAMRRIYAIEKKTGALVKTIKIDSGQDIVSATVGANDSIYFLTADNKIWKVQ